MLTAHSLTSPFRFVSTPKTGTTGWTVLRITPRTGHSCSSSNFQQTSRSSNGLSAAVSKYPAATREDHDDFCVAEKWQLVRGASGQPVRPHRTYELACWDGQILRTRISRPVDRSTGRRTLPGCGPTCCEHVSRCCLLARERGHYDPSIRRWEPEGQPTRNADAANPRSLAIRKRPVSRWLTERWTGRFLSPSPGVSQG